MNKLERSYKMSRKRVCPPFLFILFAFACAYAGSYPQAAMATESPSGWVEDDAPTTSGSGDGRNSLPPSVEKKDGRTILKLGVEHASSLKPIPSSLQAGSIFDERLMPMNAPDRGWYKIPTWLAGKWQRNTETIVRTVDFASGYESRPNKTFQSFQNAEFGVQTDSRGEVWNTQLADRGVSDRGSFRSVALVELQEPVKLEDDEVIFREVFTIMNVMKDTSMITESHKIESLTRYRPLQDGALETSMSVKVYNANGSENRLQENISRDRLKEPFTSTNTYKGRDLKNEFASFLRSQSLTNLIPR